MPDLEDEGQSGSGEIIYLGLDDIVTLHALALTCSESDAANQLRDSAAMEGALGRPVWHASLGDADLAMQAAVLAHGIVESQCFVDGNKRVALAAMLVFLHANGYMVGAPQSERADWILGFAQGRSAADPRDNSARWIEDEQRACPPSRPSWGR